MTRRRKIVAGVVAALAVGGGGAALAATQDDSPAAESQAIVNDAAKQLGIEPAKLSAALKQAFVNRVDAAVADGRLTREQGEMLKQRIQSSEFPLLAGPGFGLHHGGGFRVTLDVAESYLGVTAEELHTSLSSGKTLAEVAKEKGKSVDGLIDAMVAAATKELDAAVADGRLTKERRDAIVAKLKERITELVNNGLPKLGRAFEHGFRHARAA